MNKPLVEAIYELRWTVGDVDLGEPQVVDEHAGVLPGQLYDKLQGQYPIAERLPTATFPDELATFVVQHRFRAKPSAWPLFQVGPGIITLNEVDDYDWDDFSERVTTLVETLVATHPSVDAIKFRSVSLRYLNAYEFDFTSADIFDFVTENFGVEVGVSEKILSAGSGELTPFGLDSRFVFASTVPQGVANLRFVRGERSGRDALIWELSVQSTNGDVPQSSNGLAEWASNAHILIEDWFFDMLNPALLEEFK